MKRISRECFDFDRLSASCLGGLVLKRQQKEAVSRSLEGNWFWQEFNISKFRFGEGNG